MIRIQNKLEVRPVNKILVPGCEPTSATSSPTLNENRDCPATVVDLGDALDAIPGSSIEFLQGYGNQRRLLFVLPEGPPPGYGCNNCNYIEDYYAILREIGRVEEVPKPDTGPSGLCDIFSFKRAQQDARAVFSDKRSP